MRRSIIAIPLAAVIALSACGGSSGRAATTTTAEPGLEGSITVSAAASLTEPFDEIIEGFQAEHPGVTVTPTYDSSGTLSDQIIEGAPVDVFASADQEDIDKVAHEDLVQGEATVFARNQLIIVTQPGNPEGITGLADLADVGVVSLCALDAPCGTFAAEALEGADVSIPESSVTRGQNAKATLTAVSEGDAVAGIVYVTDAMAAGDAVGAVEIPDDQNVIASYPIVVLTDTQNPALAAAFAEYVASDEGQQILTDHGFLPPS